MRAGLVRCPECGTDNGNYNVICVQCEVELIGEEVRLLDKTRDLWSAFGSIKPGHPDEAKEFCDGIHQLQNIISTRIARKLTRGIYFNVTDVG